MTLSWEKIANELAAKIAAGEWPEGYQVPSEETLAQSYGVSRQTAHRAVHELKLRGLVDRKRRSGTVVSSQAPQKAGMVHLIVDHSNDFPQRDLIRAVSAVFGDRYQIVLQDVDDDPRKEIQALERAAAEASGILIYPLSTEENTQFLQELASARTPLVCIDRLPQGLNCEAVLSDNHQASLAGMRELVDAGHRRIAWFSGDNDHVSSIQDRHRAYLDGGGSPELERWFPKSLEGKPDRLLQAVYDSVFTLLHEPDPPTAIFCTQDCYAIATLEAFDRMGIAVRPEILTFNDWPPMMLRRPSSIYRIVQNVGEMGRLAAESLLRQIQGDASAPQVSLVPSQVLPPTIGFHSRPTVGAPTTIAGTQT